MVEEDERFRNVDEASANLINVLTGSELKIEAKEGKVDMCKAIDEMRQESEEKGSVETKLADIKELMKNLQITSHEAMRLLSVPGDMQKILLAKLGMKP